MAKKIAVGIDVGTSQIKIVVAENTKNENGSISPIVLAKVSTESKGLRHGYVINPEEVTESVRYAVGEAEKISKIKIKKVYLSVGGIGLSSILSKGYVMTSKADSEITDIDIKKVLSVAENEIPQNQILNKKIIHSIPLAYKVDDQVLLGRPKGMHGNKLEAKVLFIVALEQYIDDLITAVEDAGLNVEDVMAGPFASSLVNLSKTQKIAGSILVNIGSETTSFVVYENNIPISFEIINVGGNDITNDIALAFKIPIDEAESLKLTKDGGESKYSKRKLGDVIGNRLSEIFEMIELHLKKLGRNGLLPAGIILTGGGAGIPMIEEFSRNTLGLPAKTADINIITDIKNLSKELSWSTAYGLALWGLNDAEIPSSLPSSSGNTVKKLSKWVQKFLP